MSVYTFVVGNARGNVFGLKLEPNDELGGCSEYDPACGRKLLECTEAWEWFDVYELLTAVGVL